MKNNPWHHIKSEKDFQSLMVRVEHKAWHQENVYRKKIGLPVLKKRKTYGKYLFTKLNQRLIIGASTKGVNDD